MRDHMPWLGQGDIFARAPIIDVILTGAGEIEVATIYGPAILLTHDCDMDKPDSTTRQPRIQRMQFARLRAVDALPSSYQRTVRASRNSRGPFEVLYLGDVANFGESCIVLSDPYYIPSGYFLPGFVEYNGHADAVTGDKYLTAQLNDSRIGRLEESQLTLLRQKMMAFWTRLKEEQPL